MPDSGFFSETTRDGIAALSVVLALVQIYFVFRPPRGGRPSPTSENSFLRKAAGVGDTSEDLVIFMLLGAVVAIMLLSGAAATLTKQRFATTSDLFWILGRTCSFVLPIGMIWFGAGMYEEAAVTKPARSSELESAMTYRRPIQVRRRLLAAWALLTLLASYRVHQALLEGDLKEDVWGLLTFSSVVFLGSSVVACFIIVVIKIVRLRSRSGVAA